MDEIYRATIDLYILLESSSLSVVFIACETSIEDSFQESEAKVDAEFHYGPCNVEHHSVDE